MAIRYIAFYGGEVVNNMPEEYHPYGLYMGDAPWLGTGWWVVDAVNLVTQKTISSVHYVDEKLPQLAYILEKAVIEELYKRHENCCVHSLSS